MKFALSVAAFVLAAVQVLAVPPVPVKECTKSVIVQDTDVDGCAAFGARNGGVTFEQLLEWNLKLRTDCLNLDVNYPICVSVTKGECCLQTRVPEGLVTATATVPATAATLAPSSAVAGTATVSGVKPNPSSAAATSPIATSAPVGASSSVKPVTSAPSASPTPNTPNQAAGTKTSMILAAVGIMLSVAYML